MSLFWHNQRVNPIAWFKATLDMLHGCSQVQHHLQCKNKELCEDMLGIFFQIVLSGFKKFPCTSNILISNVVPVSFHESLQLDMCDLGCTSQIHWNSPYLLVEFQCLLANISVESRVVLMKSQFLPPKSFQKWHIPSPWPCPPQHRHGLRGLRGTAAWKRWNKNILDCAVVTAKC